MVLISVGDPTSKVTELTGLCDKSVRVLRKELEKGNIDSQIQLRYRGSKGKLVEVEQAVLEEIERNEYHSKQEIADMINEKFGVKVSRDSIARLLKKTELNV